MRSRPGGRQDSICCSCRSHFHLPARAERDVLQLAIREQLRLEVAHHFLGATERGDHFHLPQLVARARVLRPLPGVTNSS